MSNIIDKLINLYQSKIDELPEKEVWQYLMDNHLIFGVCYAAQRHFGVNIYGEPWVVSRKKNNYWCTDPGSCYTREEILDTLKKRLEILKSI